MAVGLTIVLMFTLLAFNPTSITQQFIRESMYRLSPFSKMHRGGGAIGDSDVYFQYTCPTRLHGCSDEFELQQRKWNEAGGPDDLHVRSCVGYLRGDVGT